MVWCWEAETCSVLMSRNFSKTLSKATAGSKAWSGIKGVTRPTCGKVMVRHQAKSTQRSSMIRAFVSKILRVTVDVLHGKS